MSTRRVIAPLLLFALAVPACRSAVGDVPASAPAVHQPQPVWIEFPRVERVSTSEPPARSSSPRPIVPVALLARPLGRFLSAWTHPGPGARIRSRLTAINPFGQRMAFLVKDLVRDRSGSRWARIQTGEEPNGAVAWVRASQVRLHRAKQRIVVDLSERRLWRYVDGKLRMRLNVAVGDEDTPTTPGHYFVWARVRYRNAGGPYGKLALGLSGFSKVVRFGPTTPGRLAIHGTSDPSDRGRSLSLGCVRVWNGDIGRLWNVPMGTPVVIRP